MKKLILGLVVAAVFLVTASAFAQGIDEYTVLLLHANGQDGSTNFVDSSLRNHPVTANGNAQIDTAQSKFGGGSAFFNGSTDYLQLPDSDNWNFSSGDFTIDFWINFTALPTITKTVTLYVQGATDSVVNLSRLFLYNDYGTYRWEFDSYNNVPAGTITVLVNSTGLSINTWYHIALVRSGNSWYWFQDGVQQVNTVTETDEVPDNTDNVRIGAIINSLTGNDYFNGWLDEFRISKGIARWTTNFTPPTAEYDTIPNTPPLAHAGADAEARVGEEVTLDGRYSYDPDGQIVSWVWRSLSDPQEAIVAKGELTTMKAHGYAEELVELTVTDNRGDIAVDAMKITNPAVIGPAGPQGSPGIAPEEVTTIQNQITTLQQQDGALQQQDGTLQQQNTEQQLRLEQDRYLLEQLPQLQKKIIELESLVP